MLDKNPNQISESDLLKIKSCFFSKNPNFILSSNTFLKTKFLIKLFESIDIPIIFLDCDLLYTGYVDSGLVKKNEKLENVVIDKKNFNNQIIELIKKIEKNRSIIVFDSLNGFYNFFEELDEIRFLNSLIMLLSSIAKKTNSIILVTAITRKNEKNEI